jgi:hypothetical protein
MQAAISRNTHLKIYAGFTHLAGCATHEGKIRLLLMKSRPKSGVVRRYAAESRASRNRTGTAIEQGIQVKQE